MDQLEYMEKTLEEALARGDMTQKEYNDEMRALQREYRDAATESAQDAYDRELEKW